MNEAHKFLRIDLCWNTSYVLNHSSMENETELFNTKIIVCSNDTCLHHNRKPIRLRSTELDMKKHIVLLTIQLLVICFTSNSQSPINITINASKDLGKINPNMYGVFFEDINLGADGGIYAELVKNRSFEFFKPLFLICMISAAMLIAISSGVWLLIGKPTGA